MRRMVSGLAAILPMLLATMAPGLSGDPGRGMRPVVFSNPCGALHAPAVGYQHVIWIWLENHSYEQLIGPPGSPAAAGAPYLNALAARCGLATNYHNITHPSLPNYLAATAGSTLGVS